MSVGNALFLLAAVWCIIHILHYATARKATSLLPAHSGSASATRRSLFGNSHHTKISLKALQVKVTTTRWNTYHDKLASFLMRRGKQNIATGFRWFYNLGSVMGPLGMLVAVLALLWMCATSGWALFQKIAPSDIPDLSGTGRLMKRNSESTEDITSRTDGYSRFSSITPVIPGVTVPLGHLPVIIVAVFISQVIHELGHTIAAALESLPMIDSGASFTVCIPAAFVSFPTAGMKALPSQARSRIIAAGPFHNIVFWCFLVFITRSGLINLASFVSGYQNVSNVGKVVIDVNLDSPLSLHLPPGAIITKLDDTSLAFPDTPTDVWTEYLQGTTKGPSLGWCVGRTVLAKSDACCTPSLTKPSAFSCFVSPDDSERGCIDPVPVLTHPHGHSRCTSSDGCPPESACVRPQKESQLMRLTVRPSASHIDEDTVVLWSGPSAEVWEEGNLVQTVRVGNWVPRIWILPLWLPPLLATFWEYLSMATLSLYFFNLLPLPYLDGAELLHALLDWVFDTKQESFSYDIEAFEPGGDYHEDTRTRRRWKERIMKYVPYTMFGIFLCGVLFAIMNAIY
ncbi:hypothetical protein BDZ97DRAFT_1668560 [Flammula alnicola]|nr:hypothetical protein BDZ97DRAFT_1668560 [Flammula alnicola]